MLRAPMKALHAFVGGGAILDRGGRCIPKGFCASDILLCTRGGGRVACKRLVLAHHCIPPILFNRENMLPENHGHAFFIQYALHPSDGLPDDEEVVHQPDTDRIAEIRCGT